MALNANENHHCRGAANKNDFDCYIFVRFAPSVEFQENLRQNMNQIRDIYGTFDEIL